MTGTFGKGQERGFLLEIRHLTYEHIDSLVELGNKNEVEFKYFTPHAFSREVIVDIIDSAKLDLYYVVIYGGVVIGYGMLRGLDEGYNNFSLGIAIDKIYYGTGLANLFMNFLEMQAKLREHRDIRLRVFNDNKRAYNFYLKLGYVYSKYDDTSVVGIKVL